MEIQQIAKQTIEEKKKVSATSGAKPNVETGSRLDQPCLGCRARRATRPTMLSPLLTNVDASHVIAYSLGGP